MDNTGKKYTRMNRLQSADAVHLLRSHGTSIGEGEDRVYVYTEDWSDRRVAETVGANVGQIANLRVENFGKIREFGPRPSNDPLADAIRAVRAENRKLAEQVVTLNNELRRLAHRDELQIGANKAQVEVIRAHEARITELANSATDKSRTLRELQTRIVAVEEALTRPSHTIGGAHPERNLI